jgi:hypothetical protein
VEVGLDGVGSWGGSGGLRGRRIIGGERKNQAEYEQERADRKRERESRS